MRDVVEILKNWDIYGEENYISEFYAFLIKSKFFSPIEIWEFLETGDDVYNAFEVLEQIITRNFLGDYPKEEKEVLDAFCESLRYG